MKNKYSGEFAGTGVSVVILTATKQNDARINRAAFNQEEVMA